MATAAVATTAFNRLNGDVLPIIGVSLLIGLGTGLANGLHHQALGAAVSGDARDVDRARRLPLCL
jgi:hypothetical protein